MAIKLYGKPGSIPRYIYANEVLNPSEGGYKNTDYSITVLTTNHLINIHKSEWVDGHILYEFANGSKIGIQTNISPSAQTWQYKLYTEVDDVRVVHLKETDLDLDLSRRIDRAYGLFISKSDNTYDIRQLTLVGAQGGYTWTDFEQIKTLSFYRDLKSSTMPFGTNTAGRLWMSLEQYSDWNINNNPSKQQSIETPFDQLTAEELINGALEPADPLDQLTDNNIHGGGGTFDFTTDATGRPEFPSLSAGNSGFCSLYMPSSTQLGELHSYLWNEQVADYLRKFVDNTQDAIISLKTIPASVDTVPSVVKYGLIGSGVTLNKANDYYTEISFNLEFEEAFGSALDYSASSYTLYLPYVGNVPLEAELFNDQHGIKHIEVIYLVDLTSGEAGVYVYDVDKSAIWYSTTCNMSVDIPISSGDKGIAQLTNLALTIAMAGAGGATMSTMASAVAGEVQDFKQSINHGGTPQGSLKHSGIRFPYLYISYPNAVLPSNYAKLNGYACNYYSKLGDLEGFTQLEIVHLNDMDLYDDELDELENMLKEGVIL